MPSSEERMMILRMVEEGKVTPEEGARLLAAIGEGQAEPEPAGVAAEGQSAPGAAAGDGIPYGSGYNAGYNAGYSQTFAGNAGTGSLNGRVFHVRVTNSMTGKHKVDVNIPLSLVEFGLRFVPQDVQSKFNAQAVRDAVTSGTRGRIVDVVDNEKGDHVEIFIE